MCSFAGSSKHSHAVSSDIEAVPAGPGAERQRAVARGLAALAGATALASAAPIPPAATLRRMTALIASLSVALAVLVRR